MRYGIIGMLMLALVMMPALTMAASYADDYDGIEQLYPDEPYYRFLDWKLLGQSAALVKDDGDAKISFTMKFSLTATDQDVYIPLSIRKSSDEFFGGFIYNVNISVAGGVSPFTTFDDIEADIETSAEIVDGHALIESGTTETFDIEVLATPNDLNIGSNFSLNLSFVYHLQNKSQFYKNKLYLHQFLDQNGMGGMNTDFVLFVPTKAVEVSEDEPEEDESTTEASADEEEIRALLERVRELLVLLLQLRMQAQ